MADVARLSGHPKDATIPLEQLIAEHSSDARAPLAALTLGRVQLNSLNLPSQAASSIEKALALGLPAGLVEDAYALLVEAYARAHNLVEARAAYRQYLTTAPQGSTAGSVP